MEYVNEQKYLESIEIKSQILAYIDDIVKTEDICLSCNDDIDIISIFKAVNIKFEIEERDILEKTIDYFNIMHKFFHKKLFVISNFKTTFTLTPQEEFYKFLNYNKIQIFIVESF